MTLPARLRLAGRLSAFVAATSYQLGRLEYERALTEPNGKGSVTHKHVSLWARRLCRIFQVEARACGAYLADGAVYPGRDARGIGRVFIFNHRSGLDILLTLSFFEAYIVSRADLAGWPLIGVGAQRVGTLFVDRSSAKSGAAVLARMTRALKEGSGVSIYPEGTAFEGDEVRPLHPGAFRAAQRAGAEIVPVGLCYADPRTVYGDESFLAHMERVAVMDRVVAAIEVGEPFASDAPLDALRKKGREELQRLVDRARARLTREN
jgi:1-acyl-sn-glycerol-3-phosphate acyltransferase